MVVVLAIKGFDVQRDARGLREAMEPVREELGVHLAQSRLRETRFPDAVRPPRNIEDAAGQRLVHRRVRFAIAGDAALVAQRLGDSLAERACRILDRVMLVAMQIALHPNPHFDQRMEQQYIEPRAEDTETTKQEK